MFRDQGRNEFHYLRFMPSRSRYNTRTYEAGGITHLGTTPTVDKSLSLMLKRKKASMHHYFSQYFDLYRSFCPHFVYSFLRSRSVDGIEQTTIKMTGVCVVIDLSGFTRLSAELSKEGPSGLDKLRTIIGDYFGNFVNIILSCGGDGNRFSPDFLLNLYFI